jgi:hypothetical protein
MNGLNYIIQVQISMGVIPAQRYDPLVTDAPSNIT